MKIYHFTLLFVIILITCVISADVQYGKLENAIQEKEKITINLNESIKDAVDMLSQNDFSNFFQSDRSNAIDTFFMSLYANMGITMSDKEKQTINNFIPVILITDIDGFYIYYFECLQNSNGEPYYERVCSEKFPYFMESDGVIYSFCLNNKIRIINTNSSHFLSFDGLQEDIEDSTIYSSLHSLESASFLFDIDQYDLIRKQVIINNIESKISTYVSYHNKFSEVKGLNYNFVYQSINDKSWASNIDDINFIVVVQGLSYGYDSYRYNKILSATANIVKKNNYVIENKSWYKLYHVKGCNHIVNSTDGVIYHSEKDCALRGAYGCTECIINGPRVPFIN